MSENLNSKNIQNDDLNLKDSDSDYIDLMNRLKKISSTIELLEKTISK